jgi:hypothetical protein
VNFNLWMAQWENAHARILAVVAEPLDFRSSNGRGLHLLECEGMVE